MPGFWAMLKPDGGRIKNLYTGWAQHSDGAVSGTWRPKIARLADCGGRQEAQTKPSGPVPSKGNSTVTERWLNGNRAVKGRFGKIWLSPHGFLQDVTGSGEAQGRHCANTGKLADVSTAAAPNLQSIYKHWIFGEWIFSGFKLNFSKFLLLVLWTLKICFSIYRLHIRAVSAPHRLVPFEIGLAPPNHRADTRRCPWKYDCHRPITGRAPPDYRMWQCGARSVSFATTVWIFLTVADSDQ
jgi:hypothetical protein